MFRYKLWKGALLVFLGLLADVFLVRSPDNRGYMTLTGFMLSFLWSLHGPK